MPLMQLSTLVLPAPFGPIRASNSPGSTCSDTSVSTVSPPNRSDRRSTVSSAMRMLPPERAVAAALLATSLAQIRLLDLAPAAQFGGRPLQRDATVLKDVAVIGNGERHADVLLHQQHGDAKLLPD